MALTSLTNKGAQRAVTPDELLQGKLYKGSDGKYVKAGDTVPSGTTHLRILVGGKPTIIEIASSVNGVVSSINDNSAYIGGLEVALLRNTEDVTEINELMPPKKSIKVYGRIYKFRGITSLPDGVAFDDGVITLTKSGFTYELGAKERKYQYIHLNQMLHDYGSDAARFVDAATYAGYIVDISGWELILDQGYELGTVIHGRGVIKQYDGDDGVIVKTGGGLDHYVTIDGNILGVLSNKKRPIRFDAGSIRPFAHDLTIKNFHSTTFINALMIDNEGIKDFEVRRLTVENIKADANGNQGDADGVCRGINYTSRGADPVTTSSGIIDGFIGRDFSDWEDCDGIAIQAFVSGNTVPVDVSVSRVVTRDVLKRAVKVQADGVSVFNIDARSDNAKAMYSVVSYYGLDGTIQCVKGRGAVNSGVDVLGFANVKDVSVVSDSTYEPGAALLVLGGSCVGAGIRGVGMESIASVRSVSAPIEKVKLSDISGSSYGVPLWLRPANGNAIELVTYSNIDVACTTAGVYALANDTSGVGELNIVLITGDVICFNDHFFNIFLNGISQRAEIKDARFDGDSVGGAKIIGGQAFIGNVSSNKSLSIELENTTKAVVNGIEGELRLTNTDSTDAAMYQSLVQNGTNTNLRTLSWS